MSIIDFAKREFLRAGYKPIEEEEGPNKWVQENVLELLEVFSKQGHSGSSAPYVANLFKKLALFDPISPIMCKDDEWSDVNNFGGTINGETQYQNKICSGVFKEGKNGKPYYIDAIIWVGEDGLSFTGNNVYNYRNEVFKSSQNIKLPFEPKSFYIDVVEINDKTYIKDESQLKDVWEYYEKPDTKTYMRLKKLNNLNEI